MLSKLMKYELKATGRVFLPLYLALLVFALINRFMLGVSASHQWQTPAVISMAVYIFIMAGIFVMTLIMTIQRFYKNLLSEEGYLMFTLPVKSWQHIVCKMLISMFWLVFSFFVAMLSIILIAFKAGDWQHITRELTQFFGTLWGYLGTSIYLYSLEAVIGIFLILASAILILYASIAVGHLFNQHRILASFAAFIGLNTLTQIISMAISFVIGHGNVWNIPPGNFLTMHTELHLFIALILLESALITAAYFAITNTILKKRLNLE